jgi:integrase/recombinase XerD
MAYPILYFNKTKGYVATIVWLMWVIASIVPGLLIMSYEKSQVNLWGWSFLLWEIILPAIKKFCRWAKKLDCIEDVYIIKAPDYKQTAPKALDRLERMRLEREVNRSGNKRDYAIVKILLYTGLRVSELVALDRSDVDLSEHKGELRVRAGKGNKARTLPLDVDTRWVIRKYLEERADDHEALLISNRDNRISVRSVQHLLEQHDFHTHQLRHTFITGLVRANQDIAVIQSLSGHCSADMILRYSKPTEEDKLRAVDGLYKD